MILIKTGVLSFFASIFILTFSACGNEDSQTRTRLVKIGVVGESNQMWTPIIADAKKEGITIQLIKFSDYSIPNRALNDGEVDLNAFQHHAFFEKDKRNRQFDLVAIGDTFISAMNIYSKKIKSVAALKDGDKIAIPNDATNGGRALKVLQAAGIIDIRPEARDTPEIKDITKFFKKVKLVEVDAANIPGLLPDVAAGVINCNYALDFGFNPGRDAIFQDGISVYSGKSFVNLIATRTSDKDNSTFRRIVEIYQTSAGVKDSYINDFKGAYISGWETNDKIVPSSCCP